MRLGYDGGEAKQTVIKKIEQPKITKNNHMYERLPDSFLSGRRSTKKIRNNL